MSAERLRKGAQGERQDRGRFEHAWHISVDRGSGAFANRCLVSAWAVSARSEAMRLRRERAVLDRLHVRFDGGGNARLAFHEVHRELR